MKHDVSAPSYLAMALLLMGQHGTSSAAESDHGRLESIIVIGRPSIEAPGGVQIRDRESIQQQPRRDGSISDLLKDNPHAQLSHFSDSSDTAGELAPANVSFHGEKFYHNYFGLDGLSNSDSLNPAHNGNSPYVGRGHTAGHFTSVLPPGHPQAFWVDPKLLARVSVYDSNVPARYGGFTGGVVDAQLRRPDLSGAFGSLSYRTSQDSWTRYHLDGDYAEQFHAAESPLAQPKFTKRQYGLILNQPLSERTGLLLAYDRQQSHIPLHHRYLKEWTNQKRRSETFLLKGLHQWDEHNQLNLTVMHAPHSGHYDPDNVKNGRFKHGGGGWRADLDWAHEAGWGDVETKLAYRDYENSLAYAAPDLYRYLPTESIDWVTDPSIRESALGGLGYSRSKSQNLTFKQDARLSSMQWGQVQHDLSGGWQLTHGRATFKRPQPTLIYGGAVPTDELNCVACVPGEQYFQSYKYNYALHAKVNNSDVAFYGQDRLKVADLTVILGARWSYGRFLKNGDLAPRLAFDYDLMGRDQTHFFGGLNRYYAGDLLTYQLRSAFRFQDDYARTSVHDEWRVRSDWEPLYRTSGLKTPYSDELNLGVSQKIANSEWQLKWVRRDGKQQFMRERYRDEATGNGYYELANKGRSQSDTFTLLGEALAPIRLGPAEVSWRIGVDYNRRKNNQTGTFDQNSWADYGIDWVILDGQIIKPEALPAMDFNQPLAAFLEVNTQIPKWSLNWTQRLRYTGSNEQYEATDLYCPQADPALCQNIEGWTTRYDKARYNGAFIVDWSFNWLKPLGQKRALSFDVDVLNVFNQKVVGRRVSTPAYEQRFRTVSYKIGRQFWLGVGYHW